MIPTGRISVDDPDEEDGVLISRGGPIILGPDVVTYQPYDGGEPSGPWVTRPLWCLRWIEWDDFPFQPEGDEIGFLVQFISNLSPDELEAAVEAQIGVDGLHTRGEWIKAALLQMVPQ